MHRVVIVTQTVILCHVVKWHAFTGCLEQPGGGGEAHYITASVLGSAEVPSRLGFPLTVILNCYVDIAILGHYVNGNSFITIIIVIVITIVVVLLVNEIT